MAVFIKKPTIAGAAGSKPKIIEEPSMKSDSFRIIITAACCFALGGCAATVIVPPPLVPAPLAYGGGYGEGLNPLFSDAFDDTRAVDVVYVTNRAPGSDMTGCDKNTYGVELSTQVSYGVCRLNVPKRHSVGGFETAPNPRADPHRYFRVLAHTPLTQEALRLQLSQGRPDILVFVHGFNVKFEDTVLRAAQIAYDLKFQGQVVLFSWPAGAAPGMFGNTFISRTYAQNKANAEGSVGTATDFFKLLAGLDKTSYVMVHSMGHQLAIPALAAASSETGKRFIGELVLNAPDMPIRDFASAVPALKNAARRITVYCSYNDNAIAASEMYNKGRRMGGCELVDGVDMVNVGEIDAPALGIGGLGHGYYASRPILTDVFQLLLGLDAGSRQFIRKSETNSTENYYLRP
ncbi:MAG: alpha/beta hydrolase [Elusimicrobiota bacterium]|nr:alpha/beta hydrolase [Elusimicrobiota bacterium]